MKKQIVCFSLVVLMFLARHPSFGQGSLAPPGAPAPTMKSLDQIEARTPISSAPFTITQPGSYYLTTNLNVTSGDAIDIITNGVTLELNGFTISSTEATPTGTAILLGGGGVSDITILNGHIRGSVTNSGSGTYSGNGFAHGIYYPDLQPKNVRVSGISVSGCGFGGIFLSVGYSTVVESCTVQTVAGYGIYALTVKNSTAIDCGDGIYGNVVSDCMGQASGSGNGIYAVTAQNCQGYSAGGGIGVYAGVAAQNCAGSSGSGYGVYSTGTAINCSGTSSTGTGLFALTAGFCVGSRSFGTAILATNANSCCALDGTNKILFKYNMP